MTLSRPSHRIGPFEADQLLVMAVALLLLQDGAPMPLVLALLYIAM